MPTQRKSRSTSRAKAQTEAAKAGLTDEQAAEQREEVKAGNSANIPKNVADTPLQGHESSHVAHRTEPDSLTRRDDSDALALHFATLKNDVTDSRGETVKAGQFGVYEETLTWDKDNYPDLCKFVCRGSRTDTLIVKYGDLVPAESRGAAPR